MKRNMSAKKKASFERILIAILIIVLALSMIGGSTLAQITKRGETINEISSGEIKVKLLNKNSLGDNMPELITSIIPGDTLDNIITVKNTCSYDEYIRISLNKTFIDSDEKPTELDSSKAHFLFNDTDWVYKEGYYYYTHILHPDEISHCLYDGIYLDTTMGNEYRKSILDVDITVEAVQSVNNGENAMVAEGWEVVVK